jgi:hypothetical protein
MKRTLLTAMLAGAALVVACDEGPMGPTTGTITVQLVTTNSGPGQPAPAAVSLRGGHTAVERAADERTEQSEQFKETPATDSTEAFDPPARSPADVQLFTGVRASVQGPTNRTLNLTESAGNWEGTIEGLQPGSYSVTVEGLEGSEVSWFGQTSGVTVVGGQNTTATVPWNTFQPTLSAPPAQTLAPRITLTISAVTAATGYDAQWANNAGFASPQVASVSGTTATIGPVNAAGTYYVRARAKNATVTTGQWSDPRSFEVLSDTTSSGDDASGAPDLGFAPPLVNKVGLNILPPGDVDWFAIRACAEDTLTAETFAARLTPASGLNTILELRDSAGTGLIDANDDALGSTDSFLGSLFPTSGLHNVVVRGTGSSVGEYELRITVQPGALNTGGGCIGGPDRVDVTPPGQTIAGVGTTVPFAAEAFDSTGALIPGSTFTWFTLNPDVVDINASSGVAMATGSGQALIAAQTDGVVGFAVVTVTAPAAAPANVWGQLPDAAPGRNLWTIWGANPARIFAAGPSTLARFDGTGWTQDPDPASAWLFGIWASSEADVWVTGFGAFRWDGANWIAQPAPTAADMWGVWGAAPNNVFVSASNGDIYGWDGMVWNTVYSDPGASLYGLWGTAANDIFVVGDVGTILRYDGSVWSGMFTGSVATLYGVWGTSATDVFAGGCGEILHYDGANWVTQVSGFPGCAYHIWGNSPTDVYAAGDFGIARYDGVSWDIWQMPGFMVGVWGTEDSDPLMTGPSFAQLFRGFRGASVTVSPTSIDTLIGVGDVVQYTAEARDAGGALISGVPFIWTTDDPAVATVDNTGLVTARGNGTAGITATAPGGAAATASFRSATMAATFQQSFSRASPGSAMSLASDGSAYFDLWGGTTPTDIYQYDLAGNFVSSVPVPIDGRALVYNPADGAYYAKEFGGSSFDWYKVDPFTGATTVVLANIFTEVQSSPALKQDGTLIFEHVGGGVGDVRVLDFATGALVDSLIGLPTGGFPSQYAIATDGARLFTWDHATATVFASDLKGRFITSFTLPFAATYLGYTLSYTNGRLWVVGNPGAGEEWIGFTLSQR